MRQHNCFCSTSNDHDHESRVNVYNYSVWFKRKAKDIITVLMFLLYGELFHYLYTSKLQQIKILTS